MKVNLLNVHSSHSVDWEVKYKFAVLPTLKTKKESSMHILI